MPCYCKSNTLRLFIRSVAQVEVPVSARLAPARQLQGPPIRSFRSTGSFRGQHTISRRAFSSTTRYSNTQDSGDQSPFLASQSQGVKRWETDEIESASNGYSNAAEGAFVDFSSDAIDALVAESKSETAFQEFDTPSEFVSKAISSGKRARSGLVERIEPTFRRTKVENTSFKLHLSAPRLPRINKDSREGPVQSSSTRSSREQTQEWTPRRREHWQIDKDARKEKYPDGWNPQKRLSPDAIAGIRALHAQLPEKYNTRALAESFEVSPEAIAKILKSKWAPSPDEETDRQRRWFKRGESIWSKYAELGVKPPKRWRQMGIGNGKPEFIKKRERTVTTGVRPALVTLPRREGGLYKLGGEQESESLEDRIL